MSVSNIAKPRIGVATPEQLRSVSGLEFLRRVAAGALPAPPIAETLDFALRAVEHGRVVFAGTPAFRFYNPLGAVHGGWAAALLDSCMGCAVHSALEAGQGYTTLELKVNFVRALSEHTGEIEAEGRLLHAGRRVATAEGRLRGADGTLYAHGTTTCLILGA